MSKYMSIITTEVSTNRWILTNQILMNLSVVYVDVLHTYIATSNINYYWFTFVLMECQPLLHDLILLKRGQHIIY